MNHSVSRAIRIPLLVAVVLAAIIGVVVAISLFSSATPPGASSGDGAFGLPGTAGVGFDGEGGSDSELLEPSGVLPDGVTLADDQYAGVAGLDAGLLAALRSAATDASADGIEFFVTSGWRSPEYQDELFADAVERYGSHEEAARWVATPETSLHVSGDAVDLGGYDAMAWLSESGAAYGLCPIYINEPWHFELRADAATAGCPRMYIDPTFDPRTQG